MKFGIWPATLWAEPDSVGVRPQPNGECRKNKNPNRAARLYASKRKNHMPQGDKSSYTDKQKRQAAHIEEGYEKKGVSKKTAKARAWATVNKETGGGKKRHKEAA